MKAVHPPRIHAKQGGEPRKYAPTPDLVPEPSAPHTLATSLREQGYGLPTIASVLGHSSIEVTGRYTLASAAETAEALEHLTIET